MKTVYLQEDDAREFEKSGYCEACLRPAKEWAEPDRFGNYKVHGDFDRNGNLAGFFCPECAEAKDEPVRPIEIYLYEPDPEKPGFARYAGNRPVGDVFQELKRRLEAEGLLPDEYFCLEYPEPLKPKAEAEFPEYRWLACYAVTGASEGHYVHVDALVVRRDLDPPLLQAIPVFRGKTFRGMDFACRVAAACARHLGA